jgi:tRNA U34 5-methylaminomethyl-2-thiouridine-forming methyltransferase MnmC
LTTDGQKENELDTLFNQVLVQVAGRLNIPAIDLNLALRHGLIMGQLELRSTFPADSDGVQGCNCIFYDAFSKKMDPQLWNETELQNILAKLTAPKCVLASYAATGALNRVLKNLGFHLTGRPGFEGKRESTLAERSPE